MNKVAIIMGSKSDLEIMQKAAQFLTEHGIQNEVFVASAHRTPQKVHDIAQDIEANYDIVIAGAGLAAHLPGVMASLVTKPVIGVPINAAVNGLDSLLAIVQMPPGVPVATVAINGSKNAAILAMQILALKDPEVRKSFQEFRDIQSELKPAN
ncbi:MAG: 5-(carboxyamino)imidazole ribonucleotide mutase [Actinobacteria bacterium]|nr:5-(carboxyamino)imidazole ribonucleotide mutase [Actinomycetota bacterium]|tara:strand:+ start:380 stop:838 length:459 start_codon:yes stop_codon:yes gene_type:complete